MLCHVRFLFFFQAEDGIRYLVRSRGLGDVYKRQSPDSVRHRDAGLAPGPGSRLSSSGILSVRAGASTCLLYTSDAADERSSVDLGGRRIIKKKKQSHDQVNLTHCNARRKNNTYVDKTIT